LPILIFHFIIFFSCKVEKINSINFLKSELGHYTKAFGFRLLETFNMLGF